jgi:ABC-type multidrug transport system ATPase subunit
MWPRPATYAICRPPITYKNRRPSICSRAKAQATQAINLRSRLAARQDDVRRGRRNNCDGTLNACHMLRRSSEYRSKLGETRALDERVVELAGVRKGWPRRSRFAPLDSVARDVLVDVTFAVNRGEIVAVLGENGSGKTTLLKIVAGLARPDGGVIRLLGRDGTASPACRTQVAYAGGERGFYFRLTARENLAFFAALDGLEARERRSRIVEVARAVDVEADLDRRFADLSSGIRQRLAVARALIADPQILLLDEPTRALDPPHASSLRRFIRETLARRLGKTIIIATNLIDEARELGDRVAVLRSKTLEFIEMPPRAFDEYAIHDLFGTNRRA